MSIANRLTDKVSDFIRLKGEKLKLEIIARVAKLMSLFVTILVILTLGFFILFLLSFALSEYLNTVLNSDYYGFMITAGIYLVLLIIMLLVFQSRKMQKWLEIMFISFGDEFNSSDDLDDITLEKEDDE